MDTAAVAQELNTSTRVLRQFLRSPHSTFVPVGSGSRYEFEDTDLPTLRKRFAEWHKDGKPRPVAAPVPVASERKSKKALRQRDQEVWEEEGTVVMPDIRNPSVRARVKADAQAAEDRLMMRLMAAGLHLTQIDRKKSA